MKSFRLAANIDWLWKELAVEMKLRSAHQAGFSYIESLNPYVEPIQNWQRWLKENNLTLILINSPSGTSSDAAVRGLAAAVGKQQEFRDTFQRAMDYASALAVPMIHVTAGLRDQGLTFEEQQSCYRDNLRWACELIDSLNICLTIEPLSPRDSPGAFMADLRHAKNTLQEVGHPRLKIQYDLYHQQILHGDIISNLRLNLPQIGHIQVAGVPDRGEPDLGELNFDRIAAELNRLGYAGFVGCEYRPQTTAEAGLKWASRYRG
jgi:hydroxypyruvate isomerase